MSTQPPFPLEQLTAASFVRLQIGQKETIREACQSPHGRAFVANLLGRFLGDLPEASESARESAFLAGREMASLWPFALHEELLSSAAKASPAIATSFADGLTSLASRKAEAPVSSLPTLGEFRRVLGALEKKGVLGAKAQIQAFMAQHLAHAEATGFSGFLAREAIQLSDVLLRRAPADERYAGGVIAQAFLRDSLRWEPWNPRLWRSWAQAYQAQGGGASAEAILWEADRRFADQHIVLSQLVRLIAGDNSRWMEAYELSLQALRRFPREPYLKNIHASILLKIGRATEAAQLLAENLRSDPSHDADITLFATALMAWRKSTGEISSDDLEKILSELPATAMVFGKIGRTLQQQAASSDFLITFYRLSLGFCHDNLFLLNGLANQLLHSGDTQKISEALRIFTEVLEQDEENAYAQKGLVRSEAALGEQGASNELSQSDGDGEIEPAGSLGSGALTRPDDWSEEEELPELAPPPLPGDIVRLGRGRRISLRLGAANDDVRDDALSELHDFLREEPTFAYAQLLAVRQGIWESASTIPLTFPAAFEAALEARDARRLELLGKADPHLEILTRAARAAYGDTEAARSLIRLAAQDGERPELERKVIQMVTIPRENDGGFVFAAPEEIVDALRELNEWALSGAWSQAA